MGAREGQRQLARGLHLQPDVLDLACAATNTEPSGALSPASTDSAAVLLAAWLKFDPHDSVVTSPSILGYQAGERFLAILEGPRTSLLDPPIPLQD